MCPCDFSPLSTGNKWVLYYTDYLKIYYAGNFTENELTVTISLCKIGFVPIHVPLGTIHHEIVLALFLKVFFSEDSVL